MYIVRAVVGWCESLTLVYIYKYFFSQMCSNFTHVVWCDMQKDNTIVCFGNISVVHCIGYHQLSDNGDLQNVSITYN